MKNRVQRRSPIPAVLLVLTMAACGVSSPDGAQATGKLPAGGPTTTTQPVAATENATSARTVILHVGGMMKSKGGAT